MLVFCLADSSEKRVCNHGEIVFHALEAGCLNIFFFPEAMDLFSLSPGVISPEQDFSYSL
jgi:hypothetical protein